MSIIQFSLTKASVKTSKDTLRKIMKSRNRILFPFGCMAVWLAGCYCNLWDNRQLHCRMYNMACSATTSVPFYQVIYYVSLYIDSRSILQAFLKVYDLCFEYVHSILVISTVLVISKMTHNVHGDMSCWCQNDFKFYGGTFYPHSYICGLSVWDLALCYHLKHTFSVNYPVLLFSKAFIL